MNKKIKKAMCITALLSVAVAGCVTIVSSQKKGQEVKDKEEDYLFV